MRFSQLVIDNGMLAILLRKLQMPGELALSARGTFFKVAVKTEQVRLSFCVTWKEKGKDHRCVHTPCFYYNVTGLSLSVSPPSSSHCSVFISVSLRYILNSPLTSSRLRWRLPCCQPSLPLAFRSVAAAPASPARHGRCVPAEGLPSAPPAPRAFGRLFRLAVASGYPAPPDVCVHSHVGPVSNCCIVGVRMSG